MMLPNRRFMRSIITLMLIVFASSASAETFLTLENGENNLVVELTEEDLLAFDQYEVLTENDFIDGEVLFTGPLVRDVLNTIIDDVDALGSDEMITLYAVNDYSVEVPLEDFLTYDVIFALTENGSNLSRRDKGPIWVMYPMSQNKELQTPVYNDRMIWQLVRATLK